MSSSAAPTRTDRTAASEAAKCVEKLAGDVLRVFKERSQGAPNSPPPFTIHVADTAVTASSLPRLAETASSKLCQSPVLAHCKSKCSVCVLPSDASIAQAVQELTGIHSQRATTTTTTSSSSSSSGCNRTSWRRFTNCRTVFALPHDGQALARSSFLQTVAEILVPAPTHSLSCEAGHDDVVAFSAASREGAIPVALWRLADSHSSLKERNSSRAHAFAFAAAAKVPLVLLITFQTLNWLAKQRLLGSSLFDIAVVGNFDGDSLPTGRGANSWTVAVSSAQQVLCAASKAAASRLAGSTGDSSRKRKASTQRASRTGASACVGCCIVVCRSKAVHGVEPASSPYQRQKSAPVILTDVWSDDSDDEGQRRTHQNSERRRQQQEIANRREREKCRFKEWYRQAHEVADLVVRGRYPGSPYDAKTGQPIIENDLLPCRDAASFWLVICHIRRLVGEKGSEQHRRQWCADTAHLFDADLLEHGGWLESQATQLARCNPKIFAPAPIGNAVSSPR